MGERPQWLGFALDYTKENTPVMSQVRQAHDVASGRGGRRRVKNTQECTEIFCILLSSFDNFHSNK
jgi:hypothetical protein